MNVAELVRTLRARAKMTQEQYAKAIRVTRGAVAAYEAGTIQPSTIRLEMMARLAGLTISDLLTIPTTEETQEKTDEDMIARGNLEICLNSPQRELVISTLAYFAGRSPKEKK